MDGAVAEQAPNGFTPKRGVEILVVDDEENNLRLLARVLSRDGYTVRTAGDGREALEQVHIKVPQLILLDVTMPRMDGLSTIRQLRSQFHTRGIPIILVTARGSTADRISGFKAGADDYVVKPFDLEELKARIESALARRQWDLYCHPMTGLPGSLAIEEEVSRRIRGSEPWAFAYLDMDNFKAYNDSYGYDSGDAIIRRLAELLLQACSHPQKISESFPGHVGGDDFVLIGPVETLRSTLPEILDRFDADRQRFYRLSDIEQGGILTRDRQGVERRFPLVSVTAAVVSTLTRQISHYGRVIQIAAELKSYAKRQDHFNKSLVLWDRRRDP